MRTLSSVVVVAMLSSVAHAQVCSERALNRDLQTFRRTSLVLRDRAPSASEIDAIVTRGGLAPADLDALLRSPEFAAVQRERLRHDIYGALDIVWDTGFKLERTDPAGFGGYPDSRDVFWNRFRPSIQICDVTRLQTQFDQGVPVPAQDGRVGYVQVEPYWAPGSQIKVCAFEGQAHLTGPRSNIDCSTTAALNNPQNDCGCGPNLRFCQLESAYAKDGVFYETTSDILSRSFAEQSLRFAQRLIDGNRPWTDLITSGETEVNGPIAHYLRYQTKTNSVLNLSSRSDLGYPIPPQLSWRDSNTWVSVTSRGKVAGVLTQPHYLLKFPTNRARANRFYSSFLCSAFEAPPGGLPNPNEPCARLPNLTQRCGCASCHAALEPMAARWGRFAERGTHELSVAEFPSLDPTCVERGGQVSQRCSDYYVTRAASPAEQPYVGKLRAFLFADGFETNIEEGPQALVRQAIESGAFARCTVTKEFERMTGRAFREELSDERALREALTQRFIQSNYDLRELMRAVVATPQFQRAGGPQ